MGEVAGGKALAVKAYELPPGEAACPYHYEYEEEWLLVLSGEVTLWNTADWSRAKTITGHQDTLYAAALSPDGSTVASA